MTRTLRTLMSDLIDYAGLFPPAKLDMGGAVEAFNRARMGENDWMLGRFVCPLSRLAEFEKAAVALLPGTAATSGSFASPAVSANPTDSTAARQRHATVDRNSQVLFIEDDLHRRSSPRITSSLPATRSLA